MKKLSLLLALLMLLSTVVVPSVAEVEQVQLEARVKPILTVDGLQFKDLNANGSLDVYEDWRADTEDRITDLLAQMTLEEKVALLFHCMSAGQFSPTYPMDDQFIYEKNCPFEGNVLDGRYPDGYSMWYYINEYNITHFLDDATGTPAELIDYHNKVQVIGEETRLGIPITFSANRESNPWGSYVDMPHDALGVANDPELAKQLWTIYGKEMELLGYHLTLNPFGVELGSWYGEDPNYLAELSEIEVKAMQSANLEVCVKHFIARGGDSSFSAARSVAQMVDNWMVPWKAAIDAGCKWIMTNTSTGLSNTVRVDYDRVTMDYLRNTLDFDGVVITDWGPAGKMSGVTVDGIDLSTLNLRQQYTMMLENGVDQFGAVSVMPGEDPSVKRDISNWPDAILNAVKDGECPIELVERSARRILRSKFELGLFEDPYVELEPALALIASPEYIAEPWEITSNASLDAARNPVTVALDHQLQAASTVLVKNDDNLLPLRRDLKIYVTGSADKTAAMDAEAIAAYATVVPTMEEADVVFARLTATNDAAELIVDDANDLGKKVVLALDCTDPNTYMMENADAILFLNFSVVCDHGSSLDFILRATEPWILADMLYGTRQPTGQIVKEIARSTEQDASQWKDLQGDMGASDYVRLILMQLVKTNPTIDLPDNWGDPLLCNTFGMRYGLNPEFRYDTLVLPTIVTQVESQGWRGVTIVTKSVLATQKSGEPFTVSFVLNNDGADGVTTVQAYDGDKLVAEKLVAVNGDSWRIVELELTLEGAGEHTITIGDLTGVVTVE